MTLEPQLSPNHPLPADFGEWLPQTLLGQGGMARVYGVVHRDDPTLRRAVKVLLDPSRDLRRRLRTEGLVQATVRHDNIVTVHQIVEIDGAPALVMDLVQGPTLSALCSGAPPALSIVDDLVRDVLSGVRAAHEAGIVHRDLKPGNVLLQAGDGRWVARVTDFGIAHVDRLLDSLRTAANAMLGTLAYMAPEQLRDARRATSRSDVFSLGALLFELLIGQRCFVADDNVTLIEQITNAAPPDLHSLRDDLPDDWARAVRAALHRDPQHRPADAGALLALWTSRRGGAPWPAEVGRRLQRSFVADIVQIHSEVERSHNLPIYDDHYVRTAKTMQTVAQAVGANQLVTLVGAGGVGKTRLAVEVGRVVLGDFPGGVWFCDLTAARGVDGLVRAVAHGLDVSLTANPVAEIGDALLGRERCLIVLDNFEQVVEHATSTVAAWLARAPSATILATSRQPLGLPAEHTIAVRVLPVQPADGDPSGAVALFVARAREASGSFTVRPDEWAVIREIVEAVDGLPLAVELVAARAKSGRLTRLKKVLEGRLYSMPSAASGRGDAPHRRTLRATLLWSWDLLSQHERQLLGQVCAFQGGFSESAAIRVAVAPDVPTLLTSLVLSSLVNVRGAGAKRRYSLLVSVRATVVDAWASERAQIGLHAARQRHAHLFARWGEPDQIRALHLMDAQDWRTRALDLDNVVSAARWSLDAGHSEVGRRAALAGVALLLVLGPVHAAIALAERALAEGSAPDEVYGLLRLNHGYALQWAASATKAIDEMRRLCAWAEGEGRWSLAAEALALMVHASEEDGIAQDAEERSSRAASLAERGGDPRVRAVCAHRRADVLLRMGHVQAAERMYIDARDLAGHVGDLRLEARIGLSLGRMYLMRSRYKLADAEYRRALRASCASGDRNAEAKCRAHMGNLYRDQGMWQLAWTFYERALRICRSSGLRSVEASVVSNMGHQCMTRGQLDEAEGLLRRALHMHREQGNRKWEAYVLSSLGNVRQHTGDIADAWAFHQSALTLYEQMQSPFSRSAAHTNLGDIASRLGDTDACREHLKLAKDLALHTNNTLFQTESELTLHSAVMGDLSSVKYHADQMHQHRSEAGNSRDVAEGVFQVGLAHLLMNDNREALVFGRSAMRSHDFDKQSTDVLLADIHGLIAVALARLTPGAGSLTEAVEHRDRAQGRARLTKSSYHRCLYLCFIAEVDARAGEPERASAPLKIVQGYIQRNAIGPRSPLSILRQAGQKLLDESTSIP